ncbi:MAG: sugar transferase [Parcubacteria group bacterium]|nr:sugar transferase [Parcubacteria group bacterium]
MKRSDLFFTFLLLPVDFIMLLGAGVFVYFLRYETFLTDVRPVVFELPLPEFMRLVVLVALLWLPIFALAGMYAARRPRRLVDEFTKVILGCSTGFIAVVFFIFFRHELFGSRFIVLFGWLAAILFVFVGRLVIRSVQRALYRRGTGVLRVVVLGRDVTAERLVAAIKQDPKSGLRVVRHLRNIDDASLGLLSNIAKSGGADGVMQADIGVGRRELARLLEFCHEHHLEFSYASDTLDAESRTVAVHDVAGVPLVHIRPTPLDGWGRIAKRIMDVAFSAVVLIVGIPLAAIVGVAIKLDSTGPVLVKLTRVGEGGRRFALYKFRSMVSGAHAQKRALAAHNERTGGPLFKMANDPRITRVGRFLRRYSLDELPNFVNVLLGAMSLVGPRPHEPEEVGQYAHPHRRLLNIKPGVTGLAQISGRSDLDFKEEARLDLFYIEHWSLGMDISILLRTPWAVLSGRNAV